MSPKKQSTAARKARAAAREGAKYTEALRSASPDPAAPDWDDLVVSALSAVVAEHGVVPVTVIWNEDARHAMVQRDDGVRWGVAEPAADGVLIREVGNDVAVVAKGTRVPVPHRLDDGRVEVASLWPVVWCSNREPFWRYVHNGWSVERPGTFPHALDPMCPSPDLPYEVRIYHVPGAVCPPRTETAHRLLDLSDRGLRDIWRPSSPPGAAAARSSDCARLLRNASSEGWMIRRHSRQAGSAGAARTAPQS